MSCFSDALVACPNLQASVTDFFQTCTVVEEMSVAEFITSPVNTSGLTQAIAPGAGKVRTIEVVYQKRLSESAGNVSTNQPNPTCLATSENGNCSKTYTIDTSENIQVEEVFTLAHVQATCLNAGEYFLSRMNALLDQIERVLATSITTAFAGMAGKWSTNVSDVNINDQLVVKTLKDGTTQDLDPFTMQIIDRSIRKTGYCAAPFIFGGDSLVNYYERSLAGCCANASGVNIADVIARFGKVVMYDDRLVNILGNDGGIITQPGATVLLNWTLSGWKDGILGGATGADYRSFAMTTPRLGVPVDVIIKDVCGGGISIVITATTKLVQMPSDLFPVGDKYEGVNWVNEVLVTNI